MGWYQPLSTLDLLPTQFEPLEPIYITPDAISPSQLPTGKPPSTPSTSRPTEIPNLRIPTLTPACCSISFRCAASCDRDVFDRDVWLDVLLRCVHRSPQGFVGVKLYTSLHIGKWLGGQPYKPWTYGGGEVFGLPQTKNPTRPEGWSCWNFVNKKLNWKERPSFFFGRGGFLDWMIL